MVFLKAKRNEIILSNPKFKQKEISECASKMWRLLTLDQRNEYKQIALEECG